jgi:hypothetical protein
MGKYNNKKTYIGELKFDSQGVTGTPAFFLAYTEPGSTKVKTVTRLVGAQPLAAFKAEIDKLLAGPGKPEKKPEKPK